MRLNQANKPNPNPDEIENEMKMMPPRVAHGGGGGAGRGGGGLGCGATRSARDRRTSCRQQQEDPPTCLQTGPWALAAG